VDAADATLDAERLDAVLASLPPEWAVAKLGRDRFVAGPPGAFVLRAATGVPHQDARRVSQLARATRTGLGDHLAWIPVVDPLLVTNGALDVPVEATVVPVDLVAAVLLEGVQPLDEETLRRITGLIVERRLSPEWVPAGPATPATINTPSGA
jgi:hypothetical protein